MVRLEQYIDGVVAVAPLLTGTVIVNEGGEDIVYLQKNNTNRVRLESLKNNKTDLFLDSATVTGRLELKDGTLVVASQTMAKISGENGTYEAEWAETLLDAATEGQYVLVVVGAEAGKDFEKRVFLEVRQRTSEINE